MSKRYLALLLGAALILAGCTVTDQVETTDGRPLVGILLPDKTWESESALLSQPLLAADYRVETAYANGDPEIQQLQLETFISRSAELVILCAIDSLAVTEQLSNAKAQNIPVLAYDRMLMDTDAVSACVAIDTYAAGKQLGEYILQSMQPDTTATIELFMGSPENQNAYLFHKGLTEILQPCFEAKTLTALSGRTSFEDTCVQNASPYTASSYLLDYSQDYYADGFPDILCTGDVGMAARFKDIFPEEAPATPLVVGIDTAASTQLLNACASFPREQLAEKCVEWALLLLENPDALPKDTTQNNSAFDVPTYLLQPTIVK